MIRLVFSVSTLPEIRCMLAASGIVFASSGALGQTVIPNSTYHYAIEDLTQPDAIRRGVTTEKGIPDGGVILAPNTKFRLWRLEDSSKLIAVVEFETPPSGSAFSIPETPFRLTDTRDRDSDGLSDEAEFIIGTREDIADTDSDGIPDGAEFDQGLDPLTGLGSQTGIIVAVDTPGNAVDVCAIDNVAVLADSGSGVSIFNVFNRMNATLIGRVPTPGSAQAVACEGTRIAVADGVFGLAIIDFSNPLNAHIEHQVLMSSEAVAVAATAGVAFLGLANGDVMAVEMATGRVQDILASGVKIHDIRLAGDLIFVLQQGSLSVLDFQNSILTERGSGIPVMNPGGGNGRMRLFVGGGVAYAAHQRGYQTFDVSDPDNLALLGTLNEARFGWKQVVPNGSGLAVTLTGPNSDGTPTDVSVFDVSDPTDLDTFQTTFPTPGRARAATIFNGLAYVADGANGLQVVNYSSSDVSGVPPTINFTTTAAGNTIEEGQIIRLAAAVTDDVQVRNVEFFRNGQRINTDGNFPFEFRFVAPSRTEMTEFTVHAVASDTGGNKTTSATLIIAVTPDTIPPTLQASNPSDNSLVQSTVGLRLTFSEQINVASLLAGGITLVGAGADGSFDTSDDLSLAPSIQWEEDTQTVSITPQQELAVGSYRIIVATSVTDIAGNAIAAAQVTEFQVASTDDTDNDGVPDAFESLLGLIVGQADSDSNGTPDGDEDFDSDNLFNRAEFVFSRDPTDMDTDNNGILDGDEDSDLDDLSDGLEFVHGSDPFDPETDGDGIWDGAEVEFGFDPTDPTSNPMLARGATTSGNRSAVFSIGTWASGSSQKEPTRETTVILYGTGGGKPFATSKPPVKVDTRNP